MAPAVKTTVADIASLRYTPSSMAQSLKRGKSGLIGGIVNYPFQFGDVLAAWPLLLKGVWVTLQLSFLAMVPRWSRTSAVREAMQ